MSEFVYQYIWSMSDGYYTIYRIDIRNIKPPVAIAKLYSIDSDDSDEAHFVLDKFFVRANQCDLASFSKSTIEGEGIYDNEGNRLVDNGRSEDGRNVTYQFIWNSWEFVVIYEVDLDSKTAPISLGKLYRLEEDDEEDALHKIFVEYIEAQCEIFTQKL